MKRRDWRVLALVLAMTAAGPALAATERPRAQEDSPLTAQDRDHLREFLSRPGARTMCLRLDDTGAEGVACFDTSRYTAESDPSDDYHAFRILGAARGRAGATLERVKVRVGFPSGHTTDWEPGQDYTVDETSLVRAEDPMTRRRLEEVADSYVEEAGASLLAHHWEEAGDPDAAVRYLLLAADNAGRAWAKGEAVALLNHVLDLIPEMAVDRRRNVRLRRAAMRLEAVDYVTAAAELDALLPELTGREHLEALLTRARCAGLLQDASAFAFGQQAVELARAQGHDDLVGPALGMVATGANLAGRPAEALAMAERALDAWFPGSRPSDMAWCVSLAGLATYHLGRHEEATRYGRRGHDLAREIHSSEVLILSGGHVGMGLTGAGRHQEALAFLEPLIVHALELGTVLPWTARAMNIAGGTLRELYALDEARARNQEAAEVAARAPFPIAMAQSEVDLLFVDLAEGEVGKADLAWPRLWEAAQGLKGFHQWLVSGRLEAARAEISLGLGDHEAAAAAATAATASAQRHGRLKYEVLARVLLAEALAGLGRPEEGLAQARAARDGAERLGHPPSRWRAEATLSRILAATGDDAGAEAALGSARRTIGDFAAGLSEARRAVLLAAEPVAAILAG